MIVGHLVIELDAKNRVGHLHLCAIESDDAISTRTPGPLPWMDEPDPYPGAQKCQRCSRWGHRYLGCVYTGVLSTAHHDSTTARRARRMAEQISLSGL